MLASVHNADGRAPVHGWARIATGAVQDILVNRTWRRAFDSARITSEEVPVDSFRRLRGLAPAIADLPAMPMSPEQVDEMLGRHRRGLGALLFDAAVRVMPSADRRALLDRLRAEEALALAAAPVPAPLPAAAAAA